jgi:preprotein translocase subunit Sss1
MIPNSIQNTVNFIRKPHGTDKGSMRRIEDAFAWDLFLLLRSMKRIFLMSKKPTYAEFGKRGTVLRGEAIACGSKEGKDG